MGNRNVLPKFTKEETTKMIDEGRIIFFVKNKIIDATDFVDKHPAGDTCIRRRVGLNCEWDYNFHSINGKKLWEKMVIGDLKEN